MDAYGVGGGEEVHVEADFPDGDAALHDEGDHDGLQRADEADERGERQVRRVLLDGVRLQDEERGPGEGGDDDKQRAEEPVPAADGRGGRGSRGLRAAAVGGRRVPGPRQLHERALVERHQHRAGHRHHRPGDLGLAPHLLHVQLLHPAPSRPNSMQPFSVSWLFQCSHLVATNKHLFLLESAPEDHCHDEGHGRQDVAHRAGEGRAGELQPGVVEVLVDHRSAPKTGETDVSVSVSRTATRDASRSRAERD
jgi:hypothetical protein